MPEQNPLPDIETLSEDDLRRDILIPLLAATEGVSSVVDVHGKNEHGLDIIFFQESPIERLCYGLQAKKGNVSGGGTGPSTVKDLIGQIQLAHDLDHPVLIDGGTRVVIDRFIIAASGRFSETARTEIAARLQKIPVNYWDKDELLRRVRKSLPELLAVSDRPAVAYLKAVSTRFDTLDALDSVPGVARRTLSQIYEEPALRRKFDPSIGHDLSSAGGTRIPALAIAKTNSNSVVLAEQDGGKTSLLRMIALTRARDLLAGTSTPDTAQIPVLVTARDVARTEFDLLKAVAEEVSRLGGGKLSQSVSDWLAGGKLLVLVDGFSELLAPSDKEAVEASCEAFIVAYPRALVIVAGRPGDFLTPRFFTSFRHFVIEDFDQSQVASLLRRWTADTPGLADVARRLVGRVREALQLPGSPITATIGVMLYEREKRYITNIAEAVDRYMVIRLGRYAHELGIQQEIEWTRKQDLLSEVAFSMLNEGVNSLPESRIVDEFNNAFHRLGEAPRGATVLQELLGSGVLEREGSFVAFHRNAFKDFFAAHGINQRSDRDEFCERSLFDRKWGLALVFAAGLRRKNGALLHRLVKKLGEVKKDALGALSDDFFYAAYLVGKMLSNSEATEKGARLAVLRSSLRACVDSLPEFEAVAVKQVGPIGKVAALIGVEQTFFITVGVPWLQYQFLELLFDEELNDEERYLVASVYTNVGGGDWYRALDAVLERTDSTRVLLVLQNLLFHLRAERHLEPKDRAAFRKLELRVRRRLSKRERKAEARELMKVGSRIIELEIKRLRRLESPRDS